MKTWSLSRRFVQEGREFIIGRQRAGVYSRCIDNRILFVVLAQVLRCYESLIGSGAAVERCKSCFHEQCARAPQCLYARRCRGLMHPFVGGIASTSLPFPFSRRSALRRTSFSFLLFSFFFFLQGATPPVSWAILRFACCSRKRPSLERGWIIFIYSRHFSFFHFFPL